MKKSTLLLFSIILLSFLAACSGQSTTLEPLSDEDQIATIVAATLSAFPTSTPKPLTVISTDQPVSTPTASPNPTQPPTSTSIVTQAPTFNLDDFPNKILLGENDNYVVYLINSSSGDPLNATGEIIIYDKSKNLVYKIIGTFKFFGETIVFNDDKGEYLLLSNGTYTSRGALVISLNDKRQVVNTFCTTASGKAGDHLFWNDYVIFNNCDHFQNRPWGVGEAPSVTAINLKTGTETVIAKSDLTHQYAVKQIEGNTLHYFETYVANEVDWQNQDKQKINESTYDLTLLGNN